MNYFKEAIGLILLQFIFLQITEAAVYYDKYSQQTESLEKSCGGKPADIVFALDASSSIWGPDFKRQLKFVQDLISIFTISEDAVRIGMMTFSDDPHDQFDLGNRTTMSSVKSSVGRVSQSLGGTRTDLALHAMHKGYFHKRHARPGVVHIGIVITDGNSEYQDETALQAKYARDAGIYLFAIGVGQKVDIEELKKISSFPEEQYKYMVGNYSALDSIKEMLAVETCKVTTVPPRTTTQPTTTTTLPTTTTTTPPPADQGCGESLPADVIFALPPKSSPEDGAKALRFLREMSYDFDIASDKVRMALVPQECRGIKGFSFKAAKNHEDLNQLLMPPHIRRPDTAGVLRFMRRAINKNKRLHQRQLRSLGQQVLDYRQLVHNMGVVIMDCNSPHLTRTEKEALKAKKQADMELFVITVGKNVSIDEADIIASEPKNTHVFSVTDYEDLHSIRKRLVESINESCNGEWMRRRALQ